MSKWKSWLCPRTAGRESGRWFYEQAAGGYKTMLAREGTTPARLKNLKQSIPPARKITKTDLAKFLNAWDQLHRTPSALEPKNFVRFMGRIGGDEEDGTQGHPSGYPGVQEDDGQGDPVQATQKMVRPMFPAFQANVATYTVALLANRLGNKLDLKKIWLKQDISPPNEEQIKTWAVEANKVLHETSEGRMISEWAKKPECWAAVRKATYSAPADDIPRSFESTMSEEAQKSRRRRRRGDICYRRSVVPLCRAFEARTRDQKRPWLHTEHGLTWESHVQDLPVRPDFVFPEDRVVVFVDGDFWHGWRFPQWRRQVVRKMGGENWRRKPVGVKPETTGVCAGWAER